MGYGVCQTNIKIEAHLVLNHVSYICTPQNPKNLLVTRVNTRDFTVYKLMFELELSIEKLIKKNRSAGFLVIPAIIAFGFSNAF